MHITYISVGEPSPPNISRSAPTSEPIPVLTENMFAARLADAVAGEVIVYHVGLLARDRTRFISDLPEGHRIELNAIATRALRLFLASRVTRVQRRVDAGRCAYLAIVCKQPRRMQPLRFASAPHAMRIAGEVA